MRTQLLHFLRTKPVFLYLLPVFFVLHGCMENYDYIPLKDAALLTTLYLGSSLIIALLFWLFYRNFTKANLAAFLTMAFHFFFGSLYDALQKVPGGSFLGKYSFILPAAAVAFVIAFIIIKKRKGQLSRTKFYLNSLMLILIAADSFLLLGKTMKKEKKSGDLPAGFSYCDSCQTPDIYFILADEYAGNTELKEVLKFDNSTFLNELTQRKFHVLPNSSSNYNYTPFSMASILNMDYLQLQSTNRGATDLTYAYEQIKNSRLLQFLQHHKYRLHNFSIFDFEGQPGRRLETFLPARTRLITAQTFLSRAEKNLFFNLVTRLRSKAAIKRQTYVYRKNNENIYKLTWDIASKKTTHPKFVYTHLEMPHYPYYYDKNGVEQPLEKLQEGYQVNQAAYVEYLQYCNKQYLALIDHILQSASAPPVIVLMGDHGFRHFTTPVDPKYHFNNLTAVLLPSGNYHSFTDSLTSVNLFRVVLNSQYGQQLPLLKDSTSYLQD